MRQFLYAFCVAIAICASTPAFAVDEHRAFPPDNCSAASPFMGFTGVDGSNTFCNSGQDILTNAIPTCADGQQVVKENGKFVCKAQTNVPTCQPNEFLTYNGTTYQCKNSGVATCADNQVLTFNGTSYYCVNRTDTIPHCAANQFLTYNGSYQCASVNTPAALNVSCPSGQVLSGIANNQPVCVDGGGTTPTTMGDCELDSFTSPTLGGPGSVMYGHRNKDGNLVEQSAYTIFFQTYNLQQTSSQKVESGWQDRQTGYWAGQLVSTPNGSTCTIATDWSGGGTCYTCVNGTWGKYWEYAAPTGPQ